MKIRLPASGALSKVARDRVTQFLRDSGMLQRDLAAEIGIPESHLSRVLSHKPASITLATTQRLAAAIGLSLSDFFAEPSERADHISTTRELRNRWLDLLRQTEQLINEPPPMPAPDAEALRRYLLDHSSDLDAETAAELISALEAHLPPSDQRDIARATPKVV